MHTLTGSSAFKYPHLCNFRRALLQKAVHNWFKDLWFCIHFDRELISCGPRNMKKPKDFAQTIHPQINEEYIRILFQGLPLREIFIFFGSLRSWILYLLMILCTGLQLNAWGLYNVGGVALQNNLTLTCCLEKVYVLA